MIPNVIYHFVQHDRVMAEFPQDSDTSTLAVEDCECVLEGCMQLRYCRCNTRNTQTCNRYKTFHVERYPHAWNLEGLLTLHLIFKIRVRTLVISKSQGILCLEHRFYVTNINDKSSLALLTFVVHHTCAMKHSNVFILPKVFQGNF